MEVSKHAEKRVRQRINLNKKSVDRQFELALERGFRQKDLKGNLKKWVTSKVFAVGIPHECIIYNNYCFVVGKDNILITVIPIPSNLQKSVSKLKKVQK